MQQKVVKLIKPFLEILKTFDSYQVCNMLALMLEPPFQIFTSCGNFFGL
jgi:hypothetical protein